MSVQAVFAGTNAPRAWRTWYLAMGTPPLLAGAVQESLTSASRAVAVKDCGTPGATGKDTTMSKISLTVPPLPSSAVTFTDRVPTSPACGVPEKVRVASSKPSQPGSGLSSACVAL